MEWFRLTNKGSTKTPLHRRREKMENITSYLLNQDQLNSGTVVVNSDHLHRSDGLMMRSVPFSGVSVSHYEDGQLKEKGSYSNGEPDGIWEEYYKDGQLSSKGSYSNGEPWNLGGVLQRRSVTLEGFLLQRREMWIVVRRR